MADRAPTYSYHNIILLSVQVARIPHIFIAGTISYKLSLFSGSIYSTLPPSV